MAKVPYFPLYASDFLTATANMSPDEVCAYARLLCGQWVYGSIPNDMVRIERLALCPVTDFVLQHFPVGGDGQRRNFALEVEREKFEAFRAKQKENGGKGGRPAKNDNPRVISGLTQTEAKPNPKETLSLSLSLSPSISDSDSENTLSSSGKSDDAIEVLKLLNEVAGRRFRLVKTNLDFIEARLSEEGVSKEEVFKMVRRQVERWSGTAMENYLRPETLFNKLKFEGYYEARDLPVIRDGVKMTAPSREINTQIKAKLL